MASEDFGARLKSLITRFGFRPDEVSVSSQFGVGTISFKNQKGKATELVSKLRGAMKQMGVPEAAITAREVQYPADADGPAEHWGVVNVDFNKMPHSRPGAKATFKVEDRFYFGKGRKERFADDRLAKFLDVYNRNEDNNYHSENVLLLAKFLGSTDDVAQAQQIVNEHRRSSDGISEKLYKERTDLNRRLLSKFRSRYPQASI